MKLADAEKLIRFARDSIDTFFSGKDVSFPNEPLFLLKQGVFVTLNKSGDLRGCIGFPEPVYPLNKAVYESARAAAFEDTRFNQVKKSELSEITIELTILTVPELIEVDSFEKYLDKIKIGKHGLIIRRGYFSGLLLPQVFTEYNATPEQALEMTCQKAGLGKDAWKDSDAKIFTFSGQVFEETEPRGPIVEKKLY